MKIDGVMLSGLEWPEGLLVLTGADDPKPSDSDKDKQDPKDGVKPDADKEKKDDDKTPPTSVTLEGEDLRVWNNFSEERTRIHGKRDAAETERDDWKAKFEKLQKDGASDETTKTALTETTAERDTLLVTNKSLALQVAFLTDNSYDWVDPKAAMKLADLSKVEFSKDGSVSGLKVALDALAKDSPYLIKPKADDAKDDKKDDKKPPAKSGETPTNKAGGDAAQAAEDERLRRKYNIKH